MKTEFDTESLELDESLIELVRKETEHISEVNAVEPPLGVGTWVIVQFKGKKCFKYFVGKIIELLQDENDGEVVVKFAKKSDNTFKCPETVDIPAVHIKNKNIVKAIPSPKFIIKNDRVVSFKFDILFAGYNIS